MADETAKTSLTFDASGAQKGAADFKQAADQVIAANKGVIAAQQDAARLQAAAAKAGGDAVTAATDRVVKSLGSQTTFLNNLARSFDPLAPAAQRASSALGTLMDIIDKGGQNATRAMSLLGPATDRAVKAQMDMAAGVRQSASELARLTEKFDPVGASVARMAKDLTDLGQALKAGIVESSQYETELDKIALKYDEAAQAAQKFAAVQRDLVQSSRAAQTATSSQQAIGQLTGQGSGGTVGGRAVTDTKSAQESASVFEEREKLLQQFPTLETATASYHARLADVDRAVQLGTINEARATAERARAAASFDKVKQGVDPLTGALKGYAASSSQADFATRQFGVQSVQFFSSLQAGTPFMIAFIQQAHQVLDVSLATGTGFEVLTNAVKQAFSAIAGFITGNPLLTAGLAIAAVITGAVVAAESAARRMNTLTQELRAFTTDYKALAEAIDQQARKAAATTGLSLSEATQAAKIISTAANAPASSQMPGLLAMTADIAKVFTAGGIPAAAKKLALAFSDPTKAAEDLGKNGLPQMTAELTRTIQLLVLEGNTTAATDIVLKAFKDSTNKAADALTPLQEVWKKLGEIASGLGSAMLGATNAVLGFIGRTARSVIDANAEADALTYGGTATTLGERQNNPLNLTKSSPDQPGQGRFRQFNTMEEGVSAAVRQLQINQDTHQQGTLAEQIGGHFNPQTGKNEHGWAPANENNTAQYIKDVAKATGIDPNAPLNTHDRELITKVVQAMAKQEIGKTLDQKVVEAGVSAAMSGPSFTASPAGAAKDLEDRRRTAQKDFEGTQPGQKQTTAAAIAGLVELQTHVEAGSKAYEQLTTQIGLLRGANENSRSPTEAYSKTLKEQTDAMRTEGGAAQTVANILKAADEAQVAQTGAHLTAAQAAEKRAQAYVGLNAMLDLNIAQTDRATEATKGSIGLLIGGTKATDDYNAGVKARIDALQFGIRGDAEYEAQVKRSTASNIAAADAERLKSVTETATGNNVEVTRTKLRAQIDELKAARDAQGRTTEEVKAYNIAIEDLSGKLATARTPAEEMVHQTQLAGNVAGLTAGATRDLAQAIQELNEKEIARTGHGATQAQITELTNSKLREYHGRLKDLITANAVAIVANNEMATAIEAGGRAIDAANAAAQARATSLQVGKEGSPEQIAALKAATASNLELAQSKRDVSAATDISKLKDEIEFIKLETDLLNVSVEVRNRELAVLRQRQSMGLKPGEVPDAKQQQALDLAAKSADLGTFRDTTKTALSDITGMFTQSFDTIGNAITTALVSGQKSAVNFRDTLVATAQQILQMFLKLAVLNPLMNELFPGSEHRSTLMDVINGLEGKKPANDNAAGGTAGKVGSAVSGGSGLLSRAWNWITGKSSSAGPTGDSADTVLGRLRGSTDIRGSETPDVSAISDSLKEGSKNITDAVTAGAPDLGDAVSSAGPDLGKAITDVAPSFAGIFRSAFGSSSTSGGQSEAGGIIGKVIGLVGGLFGKTGSPSAFAGTDIDLGAAEATAKAFTAGLPAPEFGTVNSLSPTGILHSGGWVGFDSVPSRLMSWPDLDTLPRFHSGLGGDEFAAILQKGERVLTSGQQQRVAAAANSNSGSRGPVTMNFNFPSNASPDQFRRAGQQVAGQVEGALARASRRNNSG